MDDKIRLKNTHPDVVIATSHACIVRINKGIVYNKITTDSTNPSINAGYMVRGLDESINWKRAMKGVLSYDDDFLDHLLWEIERFGSVDLIIDPKYVDELDDRGIKISKVRTMKIVDGDDEHATQDDQSNQQEKTYRYGVEIPDPPPMPKNWKSHERAEERIQEAVQLLMKADDYESAKQLMDTMSEIKSKRTTKSC